MRLDRYANPTWKNQGGKFGDGAGNGISPGTQEKPPSSQDGEQDGPPQTPSPLPPVGSPKVTDSTVARRRQFAPPLRRSHTDGRTSAVTRDLEGDDGEQSQNSDPWEAGEDGSGEARGDKTPTPTTGQFKEMLGSYIDQEAEVDRLIEMAERVSEHRVKEERRRVELEAAAAIERSALLTPDIKNALLSPSQKSALASTPAGLGLQGFLSPMPPLPSGASSVYSPSPLPTGGSSAYSPQPSARSDGLSPAVPVSPVVSRRVEIKLHIRELRVKQRLLPAATLLSHLGSSSYSGSEQQIQKHAKAAAGYAYIALSFARNENVDPALQGRCAYYVALAEFLLAEKNDSGLPLPPISDKHSSWSVEDDENDVSVAIRYFQVACDAQGVYDEGAWAVEWIEYFGSMEKRAEEMKGDVRPESSGSWREWIWSKVSRTKDEPGAENDDTDAARTRKPLSKQEVRDYHAAKDARRGSDDSPRLWQRLSFLSNGTSSRQSTWDYFNQPSSPPEEEQQTTTTQSPPPNDRSDRNPSPTLPPPVTSPGHSRTKSIIFQEPSDSPPSSASSSRPSIYQRRSSRRGSLIVDVLARVTGRERRRSELDKAEEGDSPFRGTFGDGEGDGVGNEALKKRRSGGEEGRGEEMVLLYDRKGTQTTHTVIMDQSPFNELPAEIRNYIYDLALTQEFTIQVLMRSSSKRGTMLVLRGDRKHFRALTRVSKQARAESLRLFYSSNSFKVSLAHSLANEHSGPRGESDVLKPLTRFIKSFTDIGNVTLGYLEVFVSSSKWGKDF
ncbi:hypothetical protein LTR37_010861 [Vermiconidia calcicola]|uniref:Uncharacterized protein n=1 Tax=Vermiconidia calcicola TaxID=1690605 RepID=A0ACC3N4Y1_9PEZI|nr:hypothetical protein LTR37_010861 [Vermiconidia calcicola]